MSNPTEQAILEFLIDTHKADKQLNAWIDKTSKAMHQKLRGPKGEYLPIEQIRKEVITAAKLLQQQYEDQNKVARAASIARIKIAKQQAEELANIQERQNSIDAVVRNTIAKKAISERKSFMDAARAHATRIRAEREADYKLDAVVRNTIAKKELSERKSFMDAAQAHKKRLRAEEYANDIQRDTRERATTKRLAAEAKAAYANSTVGAGRAGRVGAGIATMTGNYQAAGGMYAAANVLDSLDIRIPKTAALMAGLFAVPVLVGGGILMYGRELNKELANMSTLLLDSRAATADLHIEMDKAGASASRLSSAFSVDIVDVIKAYKTALSSGIESADLERFGYTAGKLAVALGEDFGSAVGILTTFKDTYGLTVGELSRASDVLANIVDKGKVNTKQMISHLGRILAPAAAAGLSIEQLGGSFATLTRGMQSTQAVTGIGRIITDTISPGKAAAKAFDELGQTYGKAAFAANGLIGFIDELQAKTKGDPSIISKLYPNIQTQRTVSFLLQTTKLHKELTAAMYTTNSATAMMIRQQDTLWFSVESGISGAIAKLKLYGSGLADAAKSTLEFLDLLPSAEGRRSAMVGTGGQKPLFEKLYSAGGNTDKAIATLDSYDKEALGLVDNMEYDSWEGAKLSRTTALRDSGYTEEQIASKNVNPYSKYTFTAGSTMHEYAEWEARKKAEEEDKKVQQDRSVSLEGIHVPEEDKLAKLTPAARDAKHVRDRHIRERITDAQQGELDNILRRLGYEEEYANERKAQLLEENSAKIEVLNEVRATQTKLRDEERAAKKETLTAYTLTAEAMEEQRTKIVAEYTKEVEAVDLVVELRTKQAKALEEFILTQRRRSEVEEDEREEIAAEKRDERLDSMQDRHAIDLEKKELQRQRQQLVAADSTSNVPNGFDSKGIQKFKKVTKQGSAINESKIAAIDAKLAQLDEAKYQRGFEHAAFKPDGSSDGYDRSSSPSFGGDRKLQELQVRMYEKNGFTRKLTDQDFLGFKQQGYSDDQMGRIWNSSTGGKHNLNGSGSELFDEYVKMDSVMDKAKDTTLESFRAVGESAQNMAVMVSAAWNGAQLAIQTYRQSAALLTPVTNTSNNTSNSTNTVNIATTANPQVIKSVLDKAINNNTIKVDNPKKLPLAKVPTTAGTGTFTSAKTGTVVIGK